MYAIGEYSEPHRKPVHPLLVAIGDRPPVIFTDGADDGKAQAVAFHLLGRAVEAVEDEAGVQGGFIGGVRHRQLPARYKEIDFTFRAVVADGIDHEVVYKAFQQRAVGADGQGTVGELFVEEEVARNALQERGQLVEEAGQADVLHLPVLAVVYLGEQEQIAVQAGQAVGVLV